MLLLAIFQIEDLTDQIPEDTEDVVPASTVVEALFPDGEIKTDLIPIDLITDEIGKLQKERDEFKRFKDALAQQEKEQEKEEEIEETGKGDCREGGFWITPKCADNCWAINNLESPRQYDYLIDIGVCESYVIVQKSEWIQKTDYDFSQVQGAYEIVNKRQMSMTELYDMLDVIKEPGYLQEPKQCFHNARLINLGSTSIDTWTNNLKQVNSRMRPLVLTKGSLYDSVRTRFNNDICNTFNEVIENNISEYPMNVLKAVDELTKSEASTTIIDERIPEESVPEELTVSKAIMDADDFNKKFTKNRACKGIRSNRITFDFEITVNDSGSTYKVDYIGDRDDLSRSNRKLLDITLDALYQTDYISELNNGKAVESVIKQPITLPRGVCQ